MEISVNIIYFLCIFILCETAEIPKEHSTNETLKNEAIDSGKSIQESNQFRFYQRNNNSSPEHVLPHTNTKWAPWTPVPDGNILKYNLFMRGDNVTVSSKLNGTIAVITGNEDLGNSTDMELTASNTTFDHTVLNNAKETDPATSSSNSHSYAVTPSSDSTKTVPDSYRNTRNRISYAKGITYYFWDTVYLILKCFKDHWKIGVIDCVTSRASTLLDGLLEIGSASRHQFLSKEVFDLIPYDETLVESPRNDEGLPIEVDEEDEEEDVYDEGSKDSGEGELM
jgi:hypothetical protein